MANPTQRYYPSPDHYQSHQQWDDARQLFNHVYQMQDSLSTLHEKVGKMTPTASTPATSENGPSSTKIAGLNVVGTPTNGQALKYNGLTGQLEWS